MAADRGHEVRNQVSTDRRTARIDRPQDLDGAEVTRVREKGFTDADMGWALERAGELWVDAGRADLARVAFSEALEHLRQDAVAAERVQARL
jgi:hypothetical protein